MPILEAIRCQSWEDFQERLNELRKLHETPAKPLLYRGQANERWPLSTTLERAGANDLSFINYIEWTLYGCLPHIESQFKRKWNFKLDHAELTRQCQNFESIHSFPEPGIY